MARQTDLNPSTTTTTTTTQGPPLPAVDWSHIKQAPPKVLPISPRQPGDCLPSADVVILTWTSAEWAALDQVFLGNTAQRTTADRDWKKAWHMYTRGAAGYKADEKSGELWGYFQMVQILDRSGRPWRVLLFKSNSHLAHPPS